MLERVGGRMRLLESGKKNENAGEWEAEWDL